MVKIIIHSPQGSQEEHLLNFRMATPTCRDNMRTTIDMFFFLLTDYRGVVGYFCLEVSKNRSFSHHAFFEQRRRVYPKDEFLICIQLRFHRLFTGHSNVTHRFILLAFLRRLRTFFDPYDVQLGFAMGTEWGV